MEEKIEKTYPCDVPAQEKRAYPCDKPEGNTGKMMQDSQSDSAKARQQGKGKRGGNAAASVVVRSGKTPEHPDYSKDRYQWAAERSAREAWGSERRTFGEKREFGGERKSFGGDRERRFGERRDDRSRGEGRSFGEKRSFDGERKSFGEKREFGGERRSFGGDRERRFGERRDDRSRGESRSFGEKRSFDGERRNFGEKRDFGGERKSFGDDRERRFGARRDDRNRGEGRSFGEKRSFDGERRSFGEKRDFGGERKNFGERRDFGGDRERRFGARRDDRNRGEGRGFDGRSRQGRDTKQDRPLLEQEFAAPHSLTVLENTQIGSFLDLGEGKKVLLPFAEQTKRPEVGEQLTVWLYEDKGGRMTATMRTPILKNGEIGILRVAEVTKIGLFLDNGVPKQLLVPFREQVCTPKAGQEVLVYAYTDKTGRAAATMRVYKHLSSESPYQADDKVSGFVYEVNPSMGVFVAVDNKYFGMIPQAEIYRPFRYGDTAEARVIRVREDGKLDLSVREKAYAAIAQDAETVMQELRRCGGKLDYADKADAALIEDIYGMSKNQFKRAIGHLYKEKRIRIDREKDSIELLEKTTNEQK